MTQQVMPKDLDQAWAEHGKKYNGHKNDYFAPIYLARKFGGGIGDHAHKVAFGNADYGFDAFHIDANARNLYLFQFKWSEDHNQFKVSMDRLIADGLERVFGNPTQDQKMNEVLHQLKHQLKEYKAAINQVYLQFIFLGDVEKAENSKALEAKREDLEGKKYLIEQYFGREVSFTVEFISNRTHKFGGVLSPPRTHVYKLPLQELPLSRDVGSGRLHVGFVPLMQLHAMHKEMGQRLFDRNIRAGLGGDRATNRAIRGALKEVLDGKSPGNFAFNHNGVTLSASKFSIEDGVATIVEPRVLNGAQTVTSLATFLEEHDKHQSLKQRQAALDEIHVLAKIVETNDAGLVTNVTICNNRQNPVEAWHLRASDGRQLELEDKFRDELHIFYERQENAFEAMHDSDLDAMGIEHGTAIEIRKLAQTFLAVQGEIDRMSHLSEVFENQKLYDATFKPQYLTADARQIVVAYKIHRKLTRAIKEIVDGAGKYAYLERARHLVWALLYHGLFSEYDREDLCEKQGHSLTCDASFSEVLCKVATPHLKLVVGIAVEQGGYAEQIENERYAFLRSKSFFDKCMTVAQKKYKWSKQPLK